MYWSFVVLSQSSVEHVHLRLAMSTFSSKTIVFMSIRLAAYEDDAHSRMHALVSGTLVMST